MDVVIKPSRKATLIAAAARTGSFTGSRVATGAPNVTSSGPVSYNPTGALLELTGTCAAGTVDVTIEGSEDGTTWFPLTLSSAFTQVTTVAATQSQSRYLQAPVLPTHIRGIFTGGGGPNYNLKLEARFVY